MPQPAEFKPERAAQTTGVTPTPAEPGAPTSKRGGRRKRVLLLGLLILIVLLAMLVGFAPTIASRPAVYNSILSMVNGKLRGALSVSSLSLSWGGPIEIRGLQVTDPAQQQVVQVPRILAEAGLWRLVTSTMTFGAITVESPSIVVHQQRDGQITLAQAFEARQPSPPGPGGALPEPQGRLVIKSGVVKVVRDGAGSYEITDLNGQVDLKTLSDVAGNIDLTLADGSKLAGEATIRQLVAQGELSPQNASGTFRLKTDRKVKIGPLAALAGQADLDGGADISVDVALGGGMLDGQVAVNVAGLQSRARAAASAKPIDAQLQVKVKWADKKLAASLNLAGEAGHAQADLAYQQSDKPLNITADQIVSAVLTGQSVTLPDFSAHAQASIDLAKLGQAVPELLRVREGAELTGGKLELTNVALQGGGSPGASAAIELKEVAARRGEQPVRLEAIAFNLASTLESGQGLKVQQLQLGSGFAQVNASGLASDLRATFKASLGQMQRELGQVFDLGTFELAGDVSGTLELKRASAEQVNVGLEAAVEKLRYADGGRSLECPRASLTQTGQLTLANQKLTKVLLQEAKADLNGEIIASASGWYDVQQAGFKADVNVSRGDLAFFASRAKNLGVNDLARYSGALRLQASAERPQGTQPLRTAGELVLQNLGLDGKPIAEGDARVTWDGVQLAADGKSLQLAAARLESTLAQLTAKDVKWQSGDKLSISGQVEGAADVASCLKAVAPLAKWEKPPELAGRLSFKTTSTAAGDSISLVGQGGIEQFVIGAGKQAIREERVQFAYETKLDQAAKSMLISKCQLASKPLTAEVTGSIKQYSGNCQLDLKGRYSASWEAISALLHELVPSTASTVIVAGTSTSEFKITGPACQKGTQPGFRGLSTGVGIAWKSAEVYGISMGTAQLAPALKDGQLTLPKTVIPAGEGKVNLGARVDFQTPEPTLKMPGKTRLLENVPVTKKLGAQLLSRINPIFLYVAHIEGRVNLSSRDVSVPMGASVKQQGAGQGRLDLSQVKMQPSGVLAELLALGGMGKDEAYPVNIGSLDLVMKDGRILYDDLVMVFPGDFDLRFRGSVGLDETLDLVVSVPVRSALLDKLGATGPTQEYAKALAGKRVEIPLVGTREKPQLDLSKVDVQTLLKDILLKEPGKQLEGILRGLGGDQKQP